MRKTVAIAFLVLVLASLVVLECSSADSAFTYLNERLDQIQNAKKLPVASDPFVETGTTPNSALTGHTTTPAPEGA